MFMVYLASPEARVDSAKQVIVADEVPTLCCIATLHVSCLIIYFYCLSFHPPKLFCR